VQVQPGRLLEQRIALVPSPDFIREYEGRQSKLRLGAWISTGVAVAGAAGALLLQADANRLYGTESTPGTFLFARRKLQDGIEVDPVTGTDYRALAGSLRSRVSQRQGLSYVAAGLGGAGAVAAAWLFIAGDDPGRYAHLRGATAGLGLAPLQGGALASLSVGF
jgi:hypothetical protein